MVLRDLPEGWVGRADDREDFGQGHKRHLGPAVFTGNGNTAQAAAGELFELRPGQFALLVALGGLRAQPGPVRGRRSAPGRRCAAPWRATAGGYVQITLGDVRAKLDISAAPGCTQCPGVVHRGNSDHTDLAFNEINRKIRNVRWSGAYTLSVLII